MLKNDYRREMILLRPLEDGISGFCRVEARLSRGSITYNIRAQRGFGGRLIAVMAGMRNGCWQAAAGGEIRADALGQAGYYWELDPRAVNKLALENYALIGVAVDGPNARLLLAGRQDRGKEIDWEAAGRAVRELLAPEAGEEAREEESEEAEEAREEECKKSEEEREEESGEAEEAREEESEDTEEEQEEESGEAEEEREEECGDTEEAQEEENGEAEEEQEEESGEAEEEREEENGEAEEAREEDSEEAQEEDSGEAEEEQEPSCGRNERSQRIRVLGATIAGEKDSELSDDELERLIERTVRGMMAQMGKAKSVQDSATDTRAETQHEEADMGVEARREDAGMADKGAACDCECEEHAVNELMAEQTRAEADMNAESDMRAETALPGARPGADCGQDMMNHVEYGPAHADSNVAVEWLLEGVCPVAREWPENCAELKPLFAHAARVYPLDVPGFVFVRAPMADGGSCAVGVKCEDGWPSEIMYLIPGKQAAQPPAGLEGYAWREGEGGGFWMVRQDAFTGNMLFDE